MLLINYFDLHQLRQSGQAGQRSRIAFNMMLEFKILVAIKLSFSFCIFLLRRHGRKDPVEMEE